VEELVEGLEEGSPNLRAAEEEWSLALCWRVRRPEPPLDGAFRLQPRFEVSSERQEGGSWTRRMHPDLHADLLAPRPIEAEAEQRELLVHVHFDAKYRVEDVESLFGGDGRMI